MSDATQAALAETWHALGGGPEWPGRLTVEGDGALPSAFAVSDLAAASVGAACLAVAELVHARRGTLPRAAVDRRLASFWFGGSIRPQGWALPPAWDAVAGDYRAADGWIKLHTNAPHHRAVALDVLGVPAEREQVGRAVAAWSADALEAAIVGRGGCAAAMRGMAAWAAHPQGRAVAADPLLLIEPGDAGPAPGWAVPAGAPLEGVRVLDKRCARLDRRRAADRATGEGLLAGADVLVHGYRPGALAGLGLDAARRRGLRPGLIDVSLDAYGWSGPWQGRRGFDSLVQMSCGIAEAGMRRFGRDRPTPLPVQALDHATGYLMAGAAVRGLMGRLATRAGCTVRVSLARTAALLAGLPPGAPGPLAPETPGDLAEAREDTAWGPALRVRPPCEVEGAPMRWRRPATPLGSAAASWAA